jgi:hypothetical protein
MDIDYLYDQLGGHQRIAVALGITPTHAWTMRERGNVPVAYWPELIRLAAEMGVSGVTADTLMMMVASRRGEMRRRQRQRHRRSYGYGTRAD